MRIQHNIPAMNAYRNYNQNRGALAKNLEKLSSGFRINRAGDDAAGLAISEKMRAQITGLSAAQKNVKDGVSLVKTAEGAMQEIQDMLKRMDYLAVQSANGTYDDGIDRANLQKEVARLQDEIDRIANSANFNGIKLLDGSLNGQWSGTAGTEPPGGPGGSGSSGSTGAPGGSAGTVGGTPGTPGTPAVPEKPAKKTSYAITLRDVTLDSDGAVEITLLGNTMKFGYAAFGKANVSAGELAEKYAAARQQVNIDGQMFSLTADNGVLKITQDAEPADASEVVSANLAAEVKVVSKVGKVSGTGATDVSFGAKAKYIADNTIYNGIYTVPNVGEIDLKNYNFDKALDYMRTHGFVGKSEPGSNFWDYFRIHYMNGQYHMELARSTDILHDPNNARIIGSSVTAKVVNTDTGATEASADGIPTKGQTAILDFGELGTISIVCTGPNNFATSNFAGSTNCGYYIVENAQEKNGGTIDFRGLNTAKLAQAAKSKGAAGSDTDSKNITMLWDNSSSQLMLYADGHMIAKSKTLDLTGKKGEISCEFFADPADDSTSLGTVSIKTGGDAALSEQSFMNWIGTAGTAGPETFTSGFRYEGTTEKRDMVTVAVSKDQGNAYTPGRPAVPGTPGTPGRPVTPSTPGGSTSGTPGTPGTPGNSGSSTSGGKGLILQIGDSSEAYDRLEIIIGDMRIKSLGTRDGKGNLTASVSQVDVGTQTGAQAAIAVIKDAINYVSSVRGDMGAYQNRLEHTASNLSVSQENIQDAESGIRDADMAQEMMAYTKNNILLQSAQAMLAQAGQMTQGILRLMQ